MSNSIEVIGLGAGDLDQLSLGIYKKLINHGTALYVRTADHPVVKQLKKEGISFTAFDQIYEAKKRFEDVYQHITDTLLEKAEKQTVVYAVPGHPMLAEKTVQLLLDQADVPVEIAGGQSYLDALFTSLKMDPIDGFQFVDGLDFDRNQIDYRHHIIFSQVYDRLIASNVKLALLEDLPPDYPVKIVEAAGGEQEKIIDVHLEELDHVFPDVHNLISVYIPPVRDDMLHHTFTRLREVIATLRGPDGCPWDRAQTNETLREYAIEEIYELIEAIDEQDDDGIVEELGDILLQVMLHSQIGEDNGYFTVEDVIRSITDKMVHRHPHVFADRSADSVDTVYATWDELKQEEKGDQRESVLDGIPAGLPGLAKAFKLQKQAAKVGFGWEDVHDIWNKLQEEMEEVHEAVDNGEQPEIEKELGDVLFVLANISRYYKVNPELALNQTNQKFISRFSYIEKQLQKQGKDIRQTSLEQMDDYWNQAKRRE
ncbi:tetrapyrrole methylase family protein / MazG family protein [Lentibacillus halodurans]|uniref:Tetrapyrrole methylase family protein / MazG family protein n=1 Tax=Lentibacillus halodurans TaxID=237679 RepID=A0A1I1A1D7_9BACI|nr:nucleoside triphosphate pyrophosphohydrolase [Lentibacillus halodurans]SFB31755.1 tetrapyrrole methylase family protein / MazG family protein [Lentibacillus halodurans]